MNQTKENFLNKFTCDETRAYARMLYELHEQNIATGKGTASSAVLEIVDFYEVIDGKELAKLGITLETA